MGGYTHTLWDYELDLDFLLNAIFGGVRVLRFIWGFDVIIVNYVLRCGVICDNNGHHNRHHRTLSFVNFDKVFSSTKADESVTRRPRRFSINIHNILS